MDLSFRIAGHGDIPLLRSLAERIWTRHYPGIISLEQVDYMLARMYSAEVIEREMKEGVIWRLILTGPEAEASGFYSLTMLPNSATAKLNKLYLLPELHGRGLGQSALAEVLREAREHGATEVSLTVNKRNHQAIRAYERAGFHIAESVVMDIGGGFVMDDHIMKRACV